MERVNAVELRELGMAEGTASSRATWPPRRGRRQRITNATTRSEEEKRRWRGEGTSKSRSTSPETVTTAASPWTIRPSCGARSCSSSAASCWWVVAYTIPREGAREPGPGEARALDGEAGDVLLRAPASAPTLPQVHHRRARSAHARADAPLRSAHGLNPMKMQGGRLYRRRTSPARVVRPMKSYLTVQ
ncbi:hypothetical protein NFI96_021971 [Prochilodus magdalenae]|nr:hypothetical protein NFI96_021971 [Prochilodus magdalenae]